MIAEDAEVQKRLPDLSSRNRCVRASVRQFRGEEVHSWDVARPEAKLGL